MIRKILILGENSYLGKSLYMWLKQHNERYQVEIVSTRDQEWEKEDFSRYDVVVDFAGIAHINCIKEDMKELFYSVNRDLTIELGQHAKDNNVKYFIYFSSMNVYGDYCENISDRNAVHPTSFYGDSKLKGDEGVRRLEDEHFAVACIRPPFVYGRGCSGNYEIISRIAKKVPVFPEFQNKKSMIYIDNLCEFTRLLIENPLSGVFTPQNKELISTSDLVKEIAKSNHRKIYFTKVFNWIIRLACKRIRMIRRAFADDCYNLQISDYFDFQYCIVDFEESILKTEQ